ncbi:MAG TPA: hypothetical protein VFB79_18475 [Candidatus Angelobacter sp.]|nr:hypothetical protein [Candidatus Angelobacter sp.]
MKLMRVSVAAVLAFAVAMTVPAVAQHDHDRDEHEHHGNDWRRGNQRVEHGGHYVRYEEHAEHHHRRIPEEHFRAHFGREHWFRINRPVIVAGAPRFQYDGYWFGFAQPLPPGWRYSDEVYVDNIDDNYYLLSPAHPGIRISINLL